MVSFPLEIPSGSPFPLENIPFGIFAPEDGQGRGGTAIGEHVIDLAALEQYGVFSKIYEPSEKLFAQNSLNAFAILPRAQKAAIREQIIELFSSSKSPVFADPDLNGKLFYLNTEVRMHRPMDIREFTDFSCFQEHCRNACALSGFPFPDNFYHSPLAYNSRSTSLILNGVNLPRPSGMYKDQSGVPEFQPCSKLDYELEMGVLLSKPVPWGTTVSSDEAFEQHVFGYVLVNDWSARDIQGYESFPAGPFNCKSFGTSISAWVIVPEALAPSLTTPLNQTADKQPVHIKHSSLDKTIYDIEAHVHLARAGQEKIHLSVTNMKHSYFSIGQMLAHRASSGGGMSTGDLVAIGTMSSPAEHRVSKDLCHNACLFELSEDGKVDVPIAGGRYLEDGDTVTLSAWATGKNGVKIGFGDLTTTITAALSPRQIA